ncbi:type II secretion system protein [Porticoccus sp. W117]|uniref:type II secretion system protein n=1 Tax=Porticoccus sp. W117 TaxID=3054777 RepID=UPI002596994B|nr:type II secretion system protein [Porticoccus sp. W117]MDM3870893.1 type II secretion system protein [Porticoccus sp. W117]
MKRQAGFTLIELIAVIVILGILAAVAVPRFIDLSAAAEQAALENVAGSISSAASLNYAAEIAREAGLSTTATPPVDVLNCLDATIGPLLQGGLPGGYSSAAASSGTTTTTADGVQLTCTLSANGSSVDYTILSANVP